MFGVATGTVLEVAGRQSDLSTCRLCGLCRASVCVWSQANRCRSILERVG